MRSSAAPPSTPTFWADTPTHTAPWRSSSTWPWFQSAAASTPPLTFSHSTTTVPPNFFAFVGR